MEQTRALISKSHQGDKEARDQLIRDNLGLVYSIGRRFEGRGQEKEDLFQIGTIGLMKAIDRFDLKFDVKFSTYAVPLITGEIKRFLRDDGMIKVSRGIKENGYKTMKTRELLIHNLGREPTIEEIAREAGLNKEDVILAIEAGAEITSMDQPISQIDGNDTCLMDQMIDTRNENEDLISKVILEQGLEKLNQNERKLIVLRYFNDNTQMEVAKKLGITQVQVSRMEKKILIQMRESLGKCE
ncbi:MAG: SigB/SigF/SigG family RNA polymerase sigma factor [Lachnospiraceae bacterium]